MKPSEAKVLARRLRMFKRDPNCHWCGKLTVLYGEQSQPDLATIDHLYSRLHPERKARYANGHDRSELLHVLACFSCNQERGKADQQGYIFVPALESQRDFARQVSAVNGIVATKPVEHPPMRVICTIEEAVRFAKEQSDTRSDKKRKVRKPCPPSEWRWRDANNPIKFQRQDVS